MAYVITWADLTVDGDTTPAADIDTKLTNIAGALKERLEDKLIVDATADPWVLKDTAGGPVTAKRLLIPHTAFRERDGGSSDPEINDIYTNILGNGQVMQAPVILPPGVTITLLELFVIVTAGTLNWEFYDYTHGVATPAKNVLSLGTAAPSGVNIISSGAVSHVIGVDKYYHVSLDTSTSGTQVMTIFGARVTYNSPSAKETY